MVIASTHRAMNGVGLQMQLEVAQVERMSKGDITACRGMVGCDVTDEEVRRVSFDSRGMASLRLNRCALEFCTTGRHTDVEGAIFGPGIPFVPCI